MGATIPFKTPRPYVAGTAKLTEPSVSDTLKKRALTPVMKNAMKITASGFAGPRAAVAS